MLLHDNFLGIPPEDSTLGEGAEAGPVARLKVEGLRLKVECKLL
jgi:hypothetical protein